VRKNGTPLCSDAFSGFMSRSPERVQFDEDCANGNANVCFVGCFFFVF
jgi:hypothetical protein